MTGPPRHRGLFTIPVTPFATDGSLDEGSLRRVLAFCLEAGAHGIVTPVNASEFSTLDPEERRTVTRIAVEETERAGKRGQVPVVVGVCARTTAETVELARYAAGVGADAVITMPAYDPPPADEGELFGFFAALADASDLPIYIQNHEKVGPPGQPGPGYPMTARAAGPPVPGDRGGQVHQGRVAQHRLQDRQDPGAGRRRLLGDHGRQSRPLPAGRVPPRGLRHDAGLREHGRARPPVEHPGRRAGGGRRATCSTSCCPSSTTKRPSAPRCTRRCSTGGGSSPRRPSASPARPSTPTITRSWIASWRIWRPSSGSRRRPPAPSRGRLPALFLRRAPLRSPRCALRPRSPLAAGQGSGEGDGLPVLG